jgi:hypothetical protein
MNQVGQEPWGVVVTVYFSRAEVCGKEYTTNIRMPFAY